MIVRKTFPKVYAIKHRKGGMYWLVNARSKKWGMDARPTFKSEEEALDRARAIAKQIEQNGTQSNVPKDRIAFVSAYEGLIERLAPHGKTPEDAVRGSISMAVTGERCNISSGISPMKCPMPAAGSRIRPC